MAGKSEFLQEIWKRYDEEHGHLPASTRDVARWAVDKGLWTPKLKDQIEQCAEDLSQALREEYHKDSKGRRVRSKHAVRVKRGGNQMVLWADMETAPRKHMVLAFAQRRNQIVGDCLQLKTDVESYNESRIDQEPIQLVLDFTDDMNELGAPTPLPDDSEIFANVH